MLKHHFSPSTYDRVRPDCSAVGCPAQWAASWIVLPAHCHGLKYRFLLTNVPLDVTCLDCAKDAEGRWNHFLLVPPPNSVQNLFPSLQFHDHHHHHPGNGSPNCSLWTKPSQLHVFFVNCAIDVPAMTIHLRTVCGHPVIATVLPESWQFLLDILWPAKPKIFILYLTLFMKKRKVADLWVIFRDVLFSLLIQSDVCFTEPLEWYISLENVCVVIWAYCLEPCISLQQTQN